MALLNEILGTDIAHVADLLPTAKKDFDVQTGLANVKTALFHRLITEKGSLIHRPDYGVGIKTFLNSPNSLANQRKLASVVQEQFLQDPRIEEVTSLSVAAVSDEEPDKVVIVVRVKVRGYDETTLEFIPFGESV
jgi:phage baseplate assembly protein W